jgi:hypothetical protein
MIIENFKLKEFLRQEKSLIEEYVVALQYMKAIKTDKVVFHLKLKEVEFIKKNLFSNDDAALIKIITIVQGFKKWNVFGFKIKKPKALIRRSVYQLTIIKFFGLVASVKEQIETIKRAEENSLTPSEINFKWIAVEGDKKMSKFGINNTLEALSGGDILKYKKIMNLEFSSVFTVLLMRKTSSELSKQMDGIKLNNS